MSKILIIDGEENFRKEVESKLKEKGFEVVLARDGEDGINKLNENSDVSVIIMDLELEKMDGGAFYLAMREDQKETTPIIVCTNLTTAAFPGKAAEFLVKSQTTIEDLVEKVKEHAGIII
jgi:DNA-binding response OmpR family regulator